MLIYRDDLRISCIPKVMGLGYGLRSLTLGIFGWTKGTYWFRGTIYILYLYIPLLTMGLMSRELGSGSIKLLIFFADYEYADYFG